MSLNLTLKKMKLQTLNFCVDIKKNFIKIIGELIY